jgi:uncharacterized protein
MAEQSPLQFPCEYPIKIMGLNETNYESWAKNFIAEYAEIISTHRTISKNKKYISVTVTITATSMEQLDKIYHALQKEIKVKAAL